MGNGLSPCLRSPVSSAAAEATAKLVFWGGTTRLLDERGPATAGEVTAELPGSGHLVCPADAFFIGLPVPVMSPGEELLPGRMYFVLPAARLSCRHALTAASLAALSPAPAKVSVAGARQCPFEYVKGDDGMPLIRVLPEFIEKVITSGKNCGGGGRDLCSTPELRKHYMQLVGTSRERPWSPRLETISENCRRGAMRTPRTLAPARSRTSR